MRLSHERGHDTVLPKCRIDHTRGPPLDLAQGAPHFSRDSRVARNGVSANKAPTVANGLQYPIGGSSSVVSAGIVAREPPITLRLLVCRSTWSAAVPRTIHRAQLTSSPAYLWTRPVPEPEASLHRSFRLSMVRRSTPESVVTVVRLHLFDCRGQSHGIDEAPD